LSHVCFEGQDVSRRSGQKEGIKAKKATVVADDSAGLFTTNRNQIASTDAEFKNIYSLIFGPTHEAINQNNLQNLP